MTMTITPSMIYWITRLDSAKLLIFIIALVLAIFTGVAIIGFFARVSNPKDVFGNECVKILPYPTIALVLTSLALVLTPSTQEAATMYVVPAVVNNEKIRDAGNKLYDLAIEWIDELKPAKKEITKSEKEN